MAKYEDSRVTPKIPTNNTSLRLNRPRVQLSLKLIWKRRKNKPQKEWDVCSLAAQLDDWAPGVQPLRVFSIPWTKERPAKTHSENPQHVGHKSSKTKSRWNYKWAHCRCSSCLPACTWQAADFRVNFQRRLFCSVNFCQINSIRYLFSLSLAQV